MEHRLFAVGLGCVGALLLGACDRGEEIPLDPEVAEVSVTELLERAELNGQRVLLTDAVVLAHDTFDEVNAGNTGTVYLAEAGNPAGKAMQCFAPVVMIGAGEFLQPGNVVAASGQFVRFTGPGCDTNPGSCFADGRVVPQIALGGTVSRSGFWQAPTPIELTAAEYLADPARYAGSLITLRNLEASGTYERRVSASGRPRIVPFPTVEGVNVSGELFMVPNVDNQVRFARITGIAGFFYDDFIVPRGPDDVELAN